MSRSYIALVVAGLLLGAQVGIAALNDSAEYVETDSTEVSEAAEPTEALADAAEPAAVEPADSAVAEVPQPEPELIPVAALNVFPISADDREMLPGLLEWLDQRVLRHIAVAGPDFPAAADDREQLPALVAYLEARDAPVVAAVAAPVVTAQAPRQ